MVEHERYAAEQWFRRRGLPSIVRGRPDHLLVRSVPAVVFVALLQIMLDMLGLTDGTSDADFERLLENPVYAVAYNALLVGWVVFPLVGAWLAMRWVRWHTADPEASVRAVAPAIAIMAFDVLLWPVIGGLLGTTATIVIDVLLNAGLVLVIVALTYAGGGSVLAWAVRAALRQVRTMGTLASRALPLLLLFTVFGFFTAEIWQAFTALARYQIWLVAGLFTVVAMAFMVALLSDEVGDLIKSRPPAAGADKLRDSPFEAYVDDHPGTDHQPLRKAERTNMVLVLVLAQALQALVFAVVTFVFFVVFGLIAVRPEVMKAWSTRDPSVGKLFSVQVPVANELLQVSMFLAAFSALYFVASTLTDARYRQSFFDPLIDHMSVSLSARHLYLARWPGGGGRAADGRM